MAALLRWDNPQQSLFERIRLQAEPDNQAHTDSVMSIKQNLSLILNTRPGGSLSAPELGIIDLNDAMMDSSELNLAICKSIRDCVLRYEPRITELTVTASSGGNTPLMLHFRVIADIQEENVTPHRVEFQLNIDHEQHYYLE